MAVGVVIPMPKAQFFDNDGDPVAAGLLYCYSAGTPSLLDTYSDSALTTPNANPVVLDAAGRATIYLTPATAYKFTLKTAALATLWTQDNVTVTAATAIVTQIVAGTNISITYTGATTGTGAVTVNVDATLVAVYTGGIALASQAAGDLMYATSANQWARLAKGTAGQGLRMNAAATVPEWAAMNKPLTDDGAALGDATTLRWSDLFLATGGVVNWLNGDVTITHSSHALNVGGAVLTVGYFGAHNFTAGGTGDNSLMVRNTTGGTGNTASLKVMGDGGNATFIYHTSASYTPATIYRADAGVWREEGVGGIALAATDASGYVSVFSGGTSEKARFASGGANKSVLTLYGSVDATLALHTYGSIVATSLITKLIGGNAAYVGITSGGAFEVYTDNGAGSTGSMGLSVAGVFSVGGKAFTFGANDSFAAGFRTVCIANA